MARDAKDDFVACQFLGEWLKQRPDDAVVIAMIGEEQNGELEVKLRHSEIAVHHLVGFVQALVERAITMAGQQPGARLLHQVKSLLDNGASQLH
jgi:hypothetical protein